MRERERLADLKLNESNIIEQKGKQKDEKANTFIAKEIHEAKKSYIWTERGTLREKVIHQEKKTYIWIERGILREKRMYQEKKILRLRHCLKRRRYSLCLRVCMRKKLRQKIHF